MATAATLNKVAVALHPVPGFCVKSKAADDALVHLTSLDNSPVLRVEKGCKIFVNVAWDDNVPPPPPATEHAIQRAVKGLDVDPFSAEAWFLPIVLSDARHDSDKGGRRLHCVCGVSPVGVAFPVSDSVIAPAGQPAIVFDSVLNPAVKSRTFRDADFKNFIIELVFQQIETQTTLILSRQIGTPNIASKGKPQSRRVLVPTSLYPPEHLHHQARVQEIPGRSTSVSDKAPPKSILKSSLGSISIAESQIPAWTWTQQGTRMHIIFDVPGVTRAAISASTLDLEPRRIVLHIPALYDMDLDLDAPDAELASIFGKNDTANQALALKRMRNLDVDGAKAEWRVGDRALVLWV